MLPFAQGDVSEGASDRRRLNAFSASFSASGMRALFGSLALKRMNEQLREIMQVSTATECNGERRNTPGIFHLVQPSTASDGNSPSSRSFGALLDTYLHMSSNLGVRCWMSWPGIWIVCCLTGCRLQRW